MKLDEPIIPYFRISKFHREICGNDVPLNVKQLLKLVGSETRDLNLYCSNIDKKYFIYIKLKQFLGHEKKWKKILTEKEKVHYPWDELIQSIKEHGIIVPVIAVKIIVKDEEFYRVFEGKHRMCALNFVEPYNSDMLVPTIIVDRDMEYMEYKRRESEGLGMSIIDMEDARLHEQQKKEKV